MAITLDSRLTKHVEALRTPAARLADMGHFIGYTAKRFAEDRCPLQAAGLGYVSLLAIVPLLAIALGVLSAFPAFDDVRTELQALVFENFLPEAGNEVADQLAFFLRNASRATGAGVIAFAVTAVLLLNNISDSFNVIWRVSEPRPLVFRFLVYWMLLTLGPLLLGSSISLSSYAFTVVEYSGITAYTPPLVDFSRVISVILSTLGFALLYYVVPNRTIRPLHALLGGLVAAMLAEVLKYLFGIYLRSFPTYQAIYGALSAVPVFLLWMYLYWAMVLVGAEVAAALPEWRAARARGHHVAAPGEQLALALAILARLREANLRGGTLRERRLVRDLPATPAEIDDTLRMLRKAQIVERSGGSRWLLSRDLETVTLGKMSEAIGLGLDPGQGWPGAAEAAVHGLAEAGAHQLDRTLEELLAQRDETGPA